jgi:hypothetical protein
LEYPHDLGGNPSPPVRGIRPDIHDVGVTNSVGKDSSVTDDPLNVINENVEVTALRGSTVFVGGSTVIEIIGGQGTFERVPVDPVDLGDKSNVLDIYTFCVLNRIAAITPGIQPRVQRMATRIMAPQPRSSTARGGMKMQRSARPSPTPIL